MTNQDIYERVKSIPLPENNYIVFHDNDDDCYYGKDNNGRIIFMAESKSPKLLPVTQETKSLLFAFNKKCTFSLEQNECTRIVHLLACKESSEDSLLAFIRLTHAFSVTAHDDDRYYSAKLFSAISSLFAKDKVASELELQGLFAELYTILYFRQHNCDLANYWQSQSRMKFDFSLTAKKRLEIKSTIRPNRIHHFRHEQLLNELYDIRIVSVMLQKSDQGLSLELLVELIRELYSDNYGLLLHIESVVSSIDHSLLASLKYDKTYLDQNIRFFDANMIPHFYEKTPDGVFNAEYDCDLENLPGICLEDITTWIREK